LPLFAKPVVAPRPADPVFIRKHLTALVRLVRNAERMPFDDGEAESWEARFPDLARLLPGDEGEQLHAAFAAELARLRRED
jgi:hypothetical protein